MILVELRPGALLLELEPQPAAVTARAITPNSASDVALMVLAGSVNKKVVAAIQLAGMPAIGFCGGDGMSFRARRKHFGGRDLG